MITISSISFYQNKLKKINYQKKIYQNYITNLGIIYSNKSNFIFGDQDKVKESWITTIKLLENKKIISIDEYSSVDKFKDKIYFKINKDYFINFLSYLYDNNQSFKVSDLSFDAKSLFNTKSSNENYLPILMIIDFLYTEPKNSGDYFREPNNFNINIWDEEKIREQIIEKLNSESKLKQQKESTQKITNNRNIEINQNIENNQVENQTKVESLNLTYKGMLSIAGEKYAIISQENKEFYLKENENYNLDNLNIKIVKVENDYVILKVNNIEHTLRLKIL